MIARVNIILSCCFLLLNTHDIRAQNSPQTLARDIRPSVVLITAYDKDGKVLSRGNGVFVSATGLVLTRRALLPAQASRTQATMADGTTYQITGTWAENTEADLATVQLNLAKRRVKPVTISEVIPTVDQRVIVITGDPGEQSPVEFSVSAILDSTPGKIIQMTGQLPPGSIGSPVIRMTGEVVGLVRFQKDGENSFSADAADGLLKLVYPVHADVQPPKLLNNPQPEYTTEARHMGVEGNVIARVLIGTDGLVKRVNIIKGLPFGLDDQALKSAYRMKFKPAMKNGQPVQYWKMLRVEFHLRY